MDVSVFGLGYVGCVTMACLARLGHRIIGIDTNPTKVELINSGKATIVEEQIGDLIAAQREAGHVRATVRAEEAISGTSVSLVCVGTPSSEHGHLDLSHIFGVAEQFAAALGSKAGLHTIAIRSTVAPGTSRRFSEIIAQRTGKRAGESFAVLANPEFLREGSGVEDFLHPPMIVLGSDCPRASAAMKELYRGIDAPVIETQIGVAEIIKFVNNSFHALKVAFGNEIGRICKTLGIDAREAMRIFCADTALNISSAYFQPGCAYGGSCLPKDLAALRALAHDRYVAAPVIEAAHESNEEQKRAAWRLVEQTAKKRFAVLGLSFKAGTDDLRNSPAVELVERMIGKGYEVTVHDENVVYSNLTGRNREYVNAKLPHLAKLLVPSLQDALAGAEAVVIASSNPAYREAVRGLKGIPIVDLVGLLDGTGAGQVLRPY
ncbi:MAG TPA: nucleotide sugar dehydrogenase [Planctomycetota bacterium]|nr:nucleotide sugar dehydrogenase [Planctomycetota bacterium]